MNTQYLERMHLITKAGLKPGSKINRVYNGHKYVACIGGIADWAVYTGHDDWDWHEIASNGDKIVADEAERIFPELASMNLPYRL